MWSWWITMWEKIMTFSGVLGEIGITILVVITSIVLLYLVFTLAKLVENLVEKGAKETIAPIKISFSQILRKKEEEPENNDVQITMNYNQNEVAKSKDRTLRKYFWKTTLICYGIGIVLLVAAYLLPVIILLSIIALIVIGIGKLLNFILKVRKVAI